VAIKRKLAAFMGTGGDFQDDLQQSSSPGFCSRIRKNSGEVKNPSTTDPVARA